jgi:hypothetical protein
MNIRLLLCFSLLIFRSTASFSREVPVLLFLSKADQPDSLGFNLVEQFPALIEPLIREGKVTLWDGPEKHFAISPEALERVEKGSGTSIRDLPQLFIYEYWNLDQKKGRLRTLGYYLAARNAAGEEVSFGYVDHAPFDSLFRNTSLRLNANGDCRLTFSYVLENKYYRYNILQYADRKVADALEALRLRESVQQFVTARTGVPEHSCKRINWIIEDTVTVRDEPTAAAARLLSSLQQYLNENREVYFNMGGDALSDFTSDKPLRFSALEAEEEWHRNGEIIETQLRSVRFWVDGKPLRTTAMADLSRMELVVGFRQFLDLLNEKEFYFRILQLNDEAIAPARSGGLRKALQTWDWNRLTEFVP